MRLASVSGPLPSSTLRSPTARVVPICSALPPRELEPVQQPTAHPHLTALAALGSVLELPMPMSPPRPPILSTTRRRSLAAHRKTPSVTTLPLRRHKLLHPVLLLTSITLPLLVQTLATLPLLLPRQRRPLSQLLYLRLLLLMPIMFPLAPLGLTTSPHLPDQLPRVLCPSLLVLLVLLLVRTTSTVFSLTSSRLWLMSSNSAQVSWSACSTSMMTAGLYAFVSTALSKVSCHAHVSPSTPSSPVKDLPATALRDNLACGDPLLMALMDLLPATQVFLSRALFPRRVDARHLTHRPSRLPTAACLLDLAR